MPYQFEWYLVARHWHALAIGAALTYWVAVASMALAAALGLALCLAQRARVVGAAARAYVQVMRAVPLYAFLLWLYYGLSVAAGVSLGPVTAGCVALGSITAAYMAEIYRAGLRAVGRGQVEAARALGLSTIAVYRDVVLPQAVRVILPAAANQFVGVLKGAAIVSVVGVPDLMFFANWASLRYFKPFEFYTVAGVILVGSTVMVAGGVALLDRRLRAGS
ncbi:MAG: amino acid ABC transporter permease [Armatimonadota bacterium]|nr:amino acid ABC transporter permease [Armatimonadota bacterium]MDR7611757.1 amino acid ABC transporter permease [Armatimonadota bacterium]